MTARKIGTKMNTDTSFKPYTIDELVTAIYEDNYSHLEFIEQMSGGDCDCNICTTMQTVLKYWGE
jgi:hypothetical protein